MLGSNEGTQDVGVVATRLSRKKASRKRKPLNLKKETPKPRGTVLEALDNARQGHIWER